MDLKAKVIKSHTSPKIKINFNKKKIDKPFMKDSIFKEKDNIEFENLKETKFKRRAKRLDIVKAETINILDNIKEDHIRRKRILKAKRKTSRGLNKNESKTYIPVFLCTICTYILKKCTCKKKKRYSIEKNEKYKAEEKDFYCIKQASSFDKRDKRILNSSTIANSKVPKGSSTTKRSNYYVEENCNSALQYISDSPTHHKTSLNHLNFERNNDQIKRKNNSIEISLKKYSIDHLKHKKKSYEVISEEELNDDSILDINEYEMEVEFNSNDEIDLNTEKVVIVDTNIMISDLAVLEKLRTIMFYGQKMKIIIPYVVVQELDNLKSQVNKQTDALNAIKWFNSYLENDDPCIQGQDFSHYQRAAEEFGETKGDDAIHTCCLLYKRNFKYVYLLSNDINLRNKALISKIRSFSARKLHKYMLECNNNNVPSNFKKKFKNSDTCNDNCNLMKWESSDLKVIEKYKPENESDSKSGIENSVITRLGPLLEYAMKESFGDLWGKIVLYKPPWSSEQILKCIEKHWIAVFIDKLSSDIKDNIKELRSSIELGNFKSAQNMLSVIYESIKDEPYKNIVSNISNSFKKCDSEIENKSTSTLLIENCIKNSIEEIGNYSVSIVNNVDDSLAQLQDMAQSDIDVSKNELHRSLEILRTTLISLGFALISLKEGTSKSPGLSLKEQINNYWKLAQRDVSLPYLVDEGVRRFATSSAGKEFLQCCISGLEEIIHSIDSKALKLN